jgi:ABC-2 type transport system permease protein
VIKALAIARRELAAYFFSPVSYLVAMLFLAVEGYSFWLFLELLNGRETPHGAVMQYFFGGTFLYWLFVMFLVAVITMRLIAEEKRAGTLEPLLTAPVDEWHVVLGKYLGALGFYVALWLPTLLYVVVLAAHAPEGGAPDAGPIAAGYLGTFLVGGSALAIGTLASALTRNQILAAVISFVTLTLLLLVGALGDALIRSGPWAPLLAYIDLFRHMEDFARGIVDSRRVIYHLGWIALALFGATRALTRRPSKRIAVELAVLLAIVAGINLYGARHYARGDWTRGHTFALSDKTRQILRALDKPVEVLVFMLPSGEGANDLYSDVHELLERARRETAQLRVEYIDVDREPERAKLVAKKYGVSGDDLVNGVIVVDAGTHSKFIGRDELADYDFGGEQGRAPLMKAWKGEQALDGALLAVTEERAPVICFTQGHGEPAIDSLVPGEFGDFAEELKRDHHEVRALDLSTAKVAEVPKECDLLAIAGPEQPFGKDDVASVEKFLAHGGRLLALLGPSFDAKVSRFVSNGLEELLERWGARLENNVVVDEPRLRSSVIAFPVSEGYADHPITSKLMHRRTLWVEAREVRAVAGAKELVRSSDAGWGESDLAVFKGDAELKYDPARDVKGPVPLAVASEAKGARMVVFGSSQIAANREVLGYNRDLLLSSVAWLLHEAPKVAIGPRTPEHLRLSLDDAQLRHVFLLCVLALPLSLLLLGLGIFWVRRA